MAVRRSRRPRNHIVVPAFGAALSMSEYIAKFSKLNQLKPSPFILGGKVVEL